MSAYSRDELRLEKRYEARFPGFTATDAGMSMQLPAAAETMQGWRP